MIFFKWKLCHARAQIRRFFGIGLIKKIYENRKKVLYHSILLGNGWHGARLIDTSSKKLPLMEHIFWWVESTYWIQIKIPESWFPRWCPRCTWPWVSCTAWWPSWACPPLWTPSPSGQASRQFSPAPEQFTLTFRTSLIRTRRTQIFDYMITKNQCFDKK